ncbi:uncharacterized protein LOC110942075 isoform X2 [Helianthus annuus]|uniref:uncharacterized protein LOC110942075 isoform X2 n=1 Tax=Helianthus annuus TaxID=4232 RepID=UPI000B8F0947|nr:uncharacterized protein LOC110942075 isoform X2 [Helianthus annuus]
MPSTDSLLLPRVQGNPNGKRKLSSSNPQISINSRLQFSASNLQTLDRNFLSPATLNISWKRFATVKALNAENDSVIPFTATVFAHGLDHGIVAANGSSLAVITRDTSIYFLLHEVELAAAASQPFPNDDDAYKEVKVTFFSKWVRVIIFSKRIKLSFYNQVRLPFLANKGQGYHFYFVGSR